MRKIDTGIVITPGNDYTTVTYLSTMAKDLKKRTKVTNALLQLAVTKTDESKSVCQIKYVGDANETYIIDEFEVSKDQAIVSIDITDEVQRCFNAETNTMVFQIYGSPAVFQQGNQNRVVFGIFESSKSGYGSDKISV